MAAVLNDPAHLGIKRFSLYKATGHRYFLKLFFFCKFLFWKFPKQKNYEEEERDRAL